MAETASPGCGTALVTGGSGFLGRHLCRELRERGFEVHAVARSAPAQEVACDRWWDVDLTDYEEVRKLWRAVHPDFVFHLAGCAYTDCELDLVLPNFHGNVVTNVNLLTVAAELGCRRLVMNASLEELTAYDAELRPVSPYAASKLAGTAYASMFHAAFAIPVVIVRIFMTYGPGQNTAKVIPHIIRALLRGQSPTLMNGDRQIDWIYVDDVVRGMIAAALAPEVAGRVFELGSGNLLPIRTVASKVRDLIGTDIQPVFNPASGEPEGKKRCAITGPATRSLNWKPEVSLDDGLRDTVDWYARNLTPAAPSRSRASS